MNHDLDITRKQLNVDDLDAGIIQKRILHTFKAARVTVELIRLFPSLFAMSAHLNNNITYGAAFIGMVVAAVLYWSE